MPRKLGTKRSGTKRFATTKEYWFAVKKTAQVEGRSIRDVRADSTFQHRWRVVTEIWKYEQEQRALAGELERSEIYPEEYAIRRDYLANQTIRERLGFSVPEVGSTLTMRELSSHQAVHEGGIYADLLERLHIRARHIPQAVGETPKSERLAPPERHR